MFLLSILSRTLSLTFSINVFVVSLFCVLIYAFSLFLSDGMDKHMSEPMIITLTDLSLADFL